MQLHRDCQRTLSITKTTSLLLSMGCLHKSGSTAFRGTLLRWWFSSGLAVFSRWVSAAAARALRRFSLRVARLRAARFRLFARGLGGARDLAPPRGGPAGLICLASARDGQR